MGAEHRDTAMTLTRHVTDRAWLLAGQPLGFGRAPRTPSRRCARRAGRPCRTRSGCRRYRCWPGWKCVCSAVTRSSSRPTSSSNSRTSFWILCASSRIRTSRSSACTTWIDSISIDGETITTRARIARCTTSSKCSWMSAKIDSDGTNMNAVSCVSPAIRYFSEIALMCSCMSLRKPARAMRSSLVGLRLAHPLPALERKLGVDHQLAARRWA